MILAPQTYLPKLIKKDNVASLQTQATRFKVNKGMIYNLIKFSLQERAMVKSAVNMAQKRITDMMLQADAPIHTLISYDLQLNWVFQRGNCSECSKAK